MFDPYAAFLAEIGEASDGASDKAIRDVACLLLNKLQARNRLTVSHEDGHHDTVTSIEANPAGELVIWLEA